MWKGRYKQNQNWYLDSFVKQISFGKSLCNLVHVPQFKGHASWSPPCNSCTSSFCLLDSMNQGHFMPSICQLKFSSSGLCCYVSLGESRSALWFLNYAPQVLWEAQDILRGLWGQTILIIIQKHCLFHCVYICTDNTEEVVPKSDAPLITNQGSITSLY